MTACTASRPRGPGIGQNWSRLQSRLDHARRSRRNGRIQEPASYIRSNAARMRQGPVPARTESASSREAVVSKSYLFQIAHLSETRLGLGYANKEAADKWDGRFALAGGPSWIFDAEPSRRRGWKALLEEACGKLTGLPGLTATVRLPPGARPASNLANDNRNTHLGLDDRDCGTTRLSCAAASGGHREAYAKAERSYVSLKGGSNSRLGRGVPSSLWGPRRALWARAKSPSLYRGGDHT
jgi:hypothetical protein